MHNGCLVRHGYSHRHEGPHIVAMITASYDMTTAIVMKGSYSGHDSCFVRQYYSHRHEEKLFYRFNKKK